MKKSNILKISLVVIDILAIIFVGYETYKWFASRYNENDDYNVYTFKKFTFSIPKNIEYTELDEYNIKLETDNYVATVEIRLDLNNFIFNDYDKFYNTLLEDGYHIGNYNVQKIYDEDVLIFDNYDNNENIKLCYFKMFYSYVAKVVLESKNDEVSYYDNLVSVYDAVNNVVYDENSQVKYNYNMYEPND